MYSGQPKHKDHKENLDAGIKATNTRSVYLTFYILT